MFFPSISKISECPRALVFFFSPACYLYCYLHIHTNILSSLTHVHTSTPFTHIHTTLTIDNLVFTLRCVYNRCSWFVLFVPCTRLVKRGRKLVHVNMSLRLRPAACVFLSLSLSFPISTKIVQLCYLLLNFHLVSVLTYAFSLQTTDRQEWMKKYGKVAVLDSTHGTNMFQMYSITGNAEGCQGNGLWSLHHSTRKTQNARPKLSFHSFEAPYIYWQKCNHFLLENTLPQFSFFPLSIHVFDGHTMVWLVVQYYLNSFICYLNFFSPRLLQRNEWQQEEGELTTMILRPTSRSRTCGKC